MNENYKYATHIISWLEKLGVPDIPLAKYAFLQLTESWVEHKNLNLEQLRDDLWSWVAVTMGTT
ncbi:hypothetical protein [Pseudoalteromonas sp. MMG024]|uniref:hypothetical protein n=1 Tax=Pseudoalteromonas sp. MMG024 TaxID=2909980 RepID=UPI001F408F30|nr:hypothetical protein [Pseudoalteromonas sp. MMG024]MCF6455255.1 hypothetical protein [Pseudoalteromonas sp. MMG024]